MQCFLNSSCGWRNDEAQSETCIHSSWGSNMCVHETVCLYAKWFMKTGWHTSGKIARLHFRWSLPTRCVMISGSVVSQSPGENSAAQISHELVQVSCSGYLWTVHCCWECKRSSRLAVLFSELRSVAGSCCGLQCCVSKNRQRGPENISSPSSTLPFPSTCFKTYNWSIIYSYKVWLDVANAFCQCTNLYKNIICSVFLNHMQFNAHVDVFFFPWVSFFRLLVPSLAVALHPPWCFCAFLPPPPLLPPWALMWRLKLTLLDDITVRCLLACLPAWGL